MPARLLPERDEDLEDSNLVHKLMPTHQTTPEKMGIQKKNGKKLSHVSTVDLEASRRGQECDGISCVRIQSFQKKDLGACLSDVTEKDKSDSQILADCYASTTVNLAEALGREVRSRPNGWKIQYPTCHRDHKTWPGALQMNQKNIKGRKVDLKVDEKENP